MLIKGDSFKIVKTIERGSVDLVLTSPPYGIGKKYEKRFSSIDSYIESISPIIKDLVATIKDGGYLIWEVGTRIEKDDIFPLSEYFLPLFRKEGLKLVNELIWEFQDNKPFAGTHYARFTQCHETVLILLKPGSKKTFNLDEVRIPQKYPRKKGYKRKNRGVFTCNPLGKNPGDVWDIHTLHFNSPEKWDHPAQFPEELCRRLIKVFSNEGDTVLDPFMGVGTTCFVAESMGRKSIGIEINEGYYEQAKRRLDGEMPNGQTSIFKAYQLRMGDECLDKEKENG